MRVQSLEPVLYAIADYLMFCREDPDSVQAVQVTMTPFPCVSELMLHGSSCSYPLSDCVFSEQELVSMIVEEVNQCAPIAEALDLLEKVG